MQVVVCHPDTHGWVFLTEQLPTCDGVAVFVPNPFAHTELDNAEQQGRDAEPKNTVPVTLAVKEDEMNGLT